MFNETIIAALTNVGPFVSNSIVGSLSLGNEYSVGINMLLMETIRYLGHYMTDLISIFILSISVITIIATKFGVNPFSKIRFFKKYNTITTVAFEKCDETGVKFLCSKTFGALNAILIQKYNITKTRYVDCNYFDVVIDDCNQHKLEEDLYLTVKRDGADNKKIYLILSSYYKNLNLITQNALNSYYSNEKKYKLTLVGSETDGQSFNYPEPMMYLTYVLIKFYGMTKLIILAENHSSRNILSTDDDFEKKKSKTVDTKSNEQKQNESIEHTKKKLKNIFLLEKCKNYKLEEDIYITIDRCGNLVKYILHSDNVNLDGFLRKCIDKYKQDISVTEYKYTLKIIGYEQTSRDGSSINYPNYLLGLCHRLITKHNVNNFRLVEINRKISKIIEEISNLRVDNIVINTIRSNPAINYYDSTCCTTYVLESDVVDLNDYLELCHNEYQKFISQKPDDTLYYFKYLGKIGNELNFSHSVLSSEISPLFETFDNMYNEHKELLIKDIHRLKDMEYYKKTGLRRKKSYLYHGEPGCGKNATVVAQALHDKRHIIDIPFSILQWNSEFHELINLRSINGINFSKSQIIVMFDEMDIGLKKILRNLEYKKDSQFDKLANVIGNIQNYSVPSEHAASNKDIPTDKSFDIINLGCILSELDGICNYDGIIVVGLTNNISDMPKALIRDMRLTPLYFTYLRQEDAVSIIQKMFNVVLSDNMIMKIPHRKISPAKLRCLCEQHDSCLNIEDFINVIANENSISNSPTLSEKGWINT